ncbi:ThuA domain-containing protein [Paenibacillus sp. UNC451MF]|uniref:ThuA domain-containing protein n=1 Tax=Paenibacillus sp. UNC451MF TaxID=1449063 RepID=UPI00048FF37C|nr:ThuA domain-containing protein [Paenibacillus sp. UNC451MF]
MAEVNEKAGQAIVLGDVERMIYHPLDRIEKDLNEILGEHFAVTFTEDYEVMHKERIRSSNVFVSYTDRWDGPVTDEQAEGLIQFVEEGGGLVVLHTGVSLSAHDKLLELIGARFTGHPPYQMLDFDSIVTGESGKRHPIVQELEPFRSEDEPYRYAFAEGVEKQIILQYTLDGESYPAAWVRHVGKGRMVSLMPGHNSNSLQHPQVRKLILRSCLWAAGRI